MLDFNNYVIDVRRPLTDPAPYVNSIPLPTSFYDCAFNPNYRPYGSLRRFREKVVDRQGNIGPFNRYYTVYDIYGVAHTYDA